jgi:hypothetical protein
MAGPFPSYLWVRMGQVTREEDRLKEHGDPA